MELSRVRGVKITKNLETGELVYINPTWSLTLTKVGLFAFPQTLGDWGSCAQVLAETNSKLGSLHSVLSGSTSGGPRVTLGMPKNHVSVAVSSSHHGEVDRPRGEAGSELGSFG